MTALWTIEELEAAVRAYVEMRTKEIEGEPFVKKEYYITLAGQFGRTEKSYEYRMQNISYVYSLMGRPWVTGLKPAKNVGARVTGELESLINKVEDQTHPPVAEFLSIVNALIYKKKVAPPKGTKVPSKSTTEITQYHRDPEVVAWVLNQANGICENCNTDAPFFRDDGTPFLEVHHLRGLADGGSDTISNAVAICPNCHKEYHYGKKKTLQLRAIYLKVPRLIAE